MLEFQDYLRSKPVVTEKQLPYYIGLVTQCFNHFNKSSANGITEDEINRWLFRV
mgnify:CR=1 FL=1|jgi:hypothetical protein